MNIKEDNKKSKSPCIKTTKSMSNSSK